MFEHLDYPNAVKRFLAECFRVLKPDGLMTIGVPDLDAIYRRYESIANGSCSAVEWKEHYLLGHPVEELNYCFHQGGEHKFLYNEDFLVKLLINFGFRNVQRRPFDTSMDSEYRREGTLYVCANKPCANAT
jgi:predicted SAM-dependent methyltransferase